MDVGTSPILPFSTRYSRFGKFDKKIEIVSLSWKLLPAIIHRISETNFNFCLTYHTIF